MNRAATVRERSRPPLPYGRGSCFYYFFFPDPNE